MATAVKATALPWTCSAEQYHADFNSVSHSILEDFRQSVRKFHAVYVARTMARKEPTEAMIRGTLLHLLKLEPEKWDDSFAIEPEFAPDGKEWYCRKGSQHDKWWTEWEEECKAKNRLRCTQKTIDEVQGMAAAIRANRQAMELLSGTPEFTIRWQDPLTELWCRCRVDSFAAILGDLKSNTDAGPLGFAKKSANLGYHRQAAHYVDGVEALTSERRPFVFVVVGTEPPHAVGLYQINERSLELGRQQNREDMERLLLCHETGDWSEPFEGEIKDLELPGFAFNNAYEVE